VSDEIRKKVVGGVVRRPAGDAEAWYELGSAAMEAGDLDQARDAFGRVVEQSPQHLLANRALAQVLSELGDSQGAIRYWRRVVELGGSDDLESLTALGIALSTDGQHPEAVRILTEVSRRRNVVSGAHADLGMALLSARLLDEAFAAFSRARDLDPESAQAHCGLGLVYQQQQRWWEAAESFRKTEQLAPDSPVGPMNLGVVLETLGEHQQARAALLRASALAPGDLEIQQALDQLAVPEAVQDEITRPALRADQFEASIAGDLRTFQLLDVLEFLRLQNKSGSLVVSSRLGAGVVRLAQGRVTSASAPGVKRLGETLVAERLITVRQLEQALARQQDDKEDTLGTLLLRDKVVTPAQLSEVVLRQILAALEEVLNWKEGAFSFHGAGDEEAPPISFNTQEVALALVKTRDERAKRPTRPGTV
jgi:tetratricopeptide (TPR) repeat protein